MKRERLFTNYCPGQSRLDLGKIDLIYCQLKIYLDGEKQRQKLKRLPPPHSGVNPPQHVSALKISS